MHGQTLTARPQNYQGFNPANRLPFYFEQPKQTVSERFNGFFTTPQLLPSILIVDLSHWNGDVDYALLAASGVVAVILKVSEAAEGTYYEYKDTQFERNWRAALDAGLIVMVYHFFRDNRGSAEFNWFMKCASAFLNDPRINGNTAVWLDVETDNGVSKETRSNRAFGFCDLSKGSGFRQGIYCSPGLVGSLFPYNDPRWANVYQWNAHWTSAAKDTLPTGWSEALRMMWQFGIHPTHSWTPTVVGAGKVDVNHGYWANALMLREWLGLAIVASSSPSPSASPSASPSPVPPPDCCDEHELRLDTIEAGQQVLTEIQQDHDLKLDLMNDTISIVAASIVSMNEQIASTIEAVEDMGFSILDLNYKLGQTTGIAFKLEEQMRKINEATK